MLREVGLQVIGRTGVIACGGMALIAMITDCIIQALSRRKTQELDIV